MHAGAVRVTLRSGRGIRTMLSWKNMPSFGLYFGACQSATRKAGSEHREPRQQDACKGVVVCVGMCETSKRRTDAQRVVLEGGRSRAEAMSAYLDDKEVRAEADGCNRAPNPSNNGIHAAKSSSEGARGHWEKWRRYVIEPLQPPKTRVRFYWT
jgi:hypothetical protein